MAEAHERKQHRILQRDWTAIREEWGDHIPNLSDAGEAPQSLLSELPDLESRLRRLPNSQVDEVPEEIPGLRAGLLHESIFLLHKGAHVLGSALVHVSNGMCTWSLSSAYHAAFFAMKSASGFLGVTAIETKSDSRTRHFLIDAWGSPQKPRKGMKWPIVVLANTDRNEQRHLWAYFQRVLSKTDGQEAFCSDEFRGILLQADYTDFARQRNDIHYRTNIWNLDDLHECKLHPEFAANRIESLDIDQPDFSLHLACGLVRMAHTMLSELAETSPAIRAEADMVKGWLGNPFNLAYHNLAK